MTPENENFMTLLEGFTNPFNPHNIILTQAISLTDYKTVAETTLAALEGQVPSDMADTIRAMAFYMATLNGGFPDAGSILVTIATATWEVIGLPADARPALTWEQRAGIIDVVMSVSKAILAGEAGRLQNMVNLDTSIPVLEPSDDPE